MKNRIDVINYIIGRFNFKSYLEIGCQDNVCFNAIVADHKVGVDPVSGGTHRMTSDQFFDDMRQNYDVIFIDGDHSHMQVLRDIRNSLLVLNPGGAIVMHDCLPPDASHESTRLCGTAWRAFAQYRQNRWLDSAVADFDFGVGVLVARDNSDIIKVPPASEMTYEMFTANREAWMRPKTASELVTFIG